MLLIAQLNNLLAPPTGKRGAPDVYLLLTETDEPQLLQDYYAQERRREADMIEAYALLYLAGEITEEEFLTIVTMS